MMNLLRISAATAALALASTALAADSSNPLVPGDAEAGKAASQPCMACHGTDGNSANPQWPKIAGQHAKYLTESLMAYKSGDRQNALMAGQSAMLSEQDMKNLSAYYAGQTMQPGVASEDAVSAAEGLYRAGDSERGIPACLACHGPKGKGNPATGWPRVAGQHAEYTAISLRAYRAGERNVSANGQMMTAVAQELTDAEIQALASYLAGLQ